MINFLLRDSTDLDTMSRENEILVESDGRRLGSELGRRIEASEYSGRALNGGCLVLVIDSSDLDATSCVRRVSTIFARCETEGYENRGQ